MTEIWLGTEASFYEYAKRRDAMLDKYGTENTAVLAFRNGRDQYDDEDDNDGFYYPNPVAYSVMANVAVIEVSGGTISTTSNFSRLIGIPSYEDIKMRLQQAYEDEDANSVLLRLSTPGGSARGAFSLSKFIHNYNNNVKPIVSYTDTSVASAGVLYGTAAASLLADEYAEVGSIGAVLTFTEVSQRLKAEGIGVKVFRSAPYKGVPNSMEKLSAKGEEVLSELVSRSHDQFVETLSTNLGLSAEHINTHIASGKMFAAQHAVDLGLVKSITSFEKLVATMSTMYQNTSTPAARPAYSMR